MKRLLVAFLAVTAAAVANAVTVFSGVSGNLSGTNLDTSLFFVTPYTLNPVTDTQVSMTFSSMSASGVSVNFLDSSFGVIAALNFLPGSPLQTLDFATGGFGGGPIPLDAIEVVSIGSPDGFLSWSVNLTQLAVIPEPSHVALGLGAVALLGAVYLRRRKV